MKSWSTLRTLSAINLQKFWMIKNVNLLKFYSSSISFISLIFLLNSTSLTPFMLMILLELLIQSNCHLLSKETPCQNQQSSTTKTRQSEHLRRSWIHNIQNQAIIFSTRFTDLIVTLILSDITQIIMNFKTCWRLYINIMHNILTSQICSLLNWNWFVISQPEQTEGKSRMWSQRLF